MGGRMDTSHKKNKQVASMKMKISKDENTVIIEFEKFVAVEGMDCNNVHFGQKMRRLMNA